MDNSLISPYMQALSTRKAQLEGTLADGFKSIVLPAHISQYETPGLHMLGKSAVWFLIIGAVALIAGLIVGSTGLWIAGAAAILSGGYLWVKGKQAGRARAFDSLGDKIYSQIQDIAAKISNDWNGFIAGQNDSLKKQIVSSAETPDAKVALIDKVDGSPKVDVDLDAIRTGIKGIDSDEELLKYSKFLSKVQGNIREAIENADGAQQTIYNSLAPAPAEK